MKHFWALPAFLRLAIASQHQFNVFDDVLAHPQYEVVMAEGVLSEDQAQRTLEAIAAARKTRNAHNNHNHNHHSEPHPTPQSSLHSIHNGPDDGPADIQQEEDGDGDILSYEDMVLNNRRYLCSIPRIPEDVDKSNGTHPTTPEDEEKELVRATNRGWELLKPMDGTCLYFYSGWWSYSFCYGQSVRQFHQLPPGKGVPIYPPIEDRGVDAYVLGRFDDPEGGKAGPAVGGNEEVKATSGASETGLARMEQKGDVRYLVQNLGGGTTCDLTGKERRIEVQFRCQPNQVDKIALIKETTTCAYLMVIDTPRLCNDVAFLPPQQTKPHAIACTPVLPEASIPAYLAAKESADADADAEDDRLTQELIDAVNLLETGQIPRNFNPDIVGDIEIGAHKFIPKDKKLEKGQIVGGEKFLATIARKSGWVASEKELQKFGIKGAKHIDDLKAEVERAAEGRDWRLDVVETRGGRELRGVIETKEVGDADAPAAAAPPQLGQQGGGETKGKGQGQVPVLKGEEKTTTTTMTSEQGEQEEEGSEETYMEKEEL